MMHDPTRSVGDEGAPFAPRRFGRWIIVALILLNLVAFVAGALSLQNGQEHFEKLAAVQTQNLAEGIEQSVSHSVDKIYQSSRAVVYEVERQLASGSLDYRHIRGIIHQQKELLSEAIGIRVIDANGNSLLGHANTKNPLANVADRDYFVNLMRHPGASTSVSKLHISRYTGDHVIVFAHRINRPDGLFGGTVIIPISADYFKALLAKYDVGIQGMLVMCDRDLGMIARQPENKEHNVAAGRGTLCAQMRSQVIDDGQLSGSFRAMLSSEPIMRTYAFRKLHNVPLYAIAGLAESEYLARWHRDLLQTILLMLAFMAVTCLAGWILYRAWQQQVRDMGALHESHAALKGALTELGERSRALATAQEKGALGVFVYDSVTRVFSVSPELLGLVGLDATATLNMKSWEAILHPDDRQTFQEYRDKEVIAKKQPFDHEYRIIRPDNGEVRWIYTFGTTEYDDEGKSVRMRGVSCDITERKRHEEQLQLAHEVFFHTREAVIITGGNAHIIDANPAFSEMTGYDREEAIGQNPRLLLHWVVHSETEAEGYLGIRESLRQGGFWEGEIECQRKNGTRYIQATKILVIRNEQNRPLRFITVASDVTQLRASQNQIKHLAYHDKLTNLPNRVMLADRLKQAIAQADRLGELLGVCYLDLDGFKGINDRWGHDTGDDVLIQIAQRLQFKIRADDTVARLGGDEFVALVSGARYVEEIEQAVRRMLSAIAQPVKVGHTEAQLTASIGVAIYTEDVSDADMLIRRADQAMYIAKRSGKNQFHLFDTEADRQMRVRHDLTSRITMGLDKNEFILHYQPKVDMLTGQVVGMEALVRWLHPEAGLLLPAEFLPIIENTELSIRLGEWVIRQALKQMRDWSVSGMDMPVSVNVSGFHLQRPDFVARLSGMLEEFPNINPEWLQLEILETTAMNDIEAVSDIISSCANHGVSFAIDDFGTGYSSLTYFRRLPTQMMKIDRTFVRDMLKNVEDNALVESIIKLAKSFNREVIAEGVETIDQGLALMRMGCHLVQGYGIAKPMPAEAVHAWVKSWTMPQAWQKAA